MDAAHSVVWHILAGLTAEWLWVAWWQAVLCWPPAHLSMECALCKLMQEGLHYSCCFHALCFFITWILCASASSCHELVSECQKLCSGSYRSTLAYTELSTALSMT